MDGPGGHNAKLNKPDRERQILYGITYVESKKKESNSKKQRAEWWLPGAGTTEK